MNEFGASRLIGIVSHGPMILQNTDEGGTAKVDPTLSVEGMAADAAATGAAVAPIAAITETTTDHAIAWDGNMDGRAYAEIFPGVGLVHISDATPDATVFTQEGFSFEEVLNGESILHTYTAEEASNDYAPASDDIYFFGDMAFAVVKTDGASFSDDELVVTLPKKGVYSAVNFDEMGMGLYIANITSPLLAVPTTTVRESAIPDSIPRLEDVDVGTSTDTLTWDGNTEGRVIVVNDETTSYVKVSDEIIPASLDGRIASAVTSDGIRHGSSVYTEGGIRKCTGLVYSGEAGATDGFVTLPETGIYFAYYPASNSYTTCVQIDGWERHVPNIVKKLPAEYIPLNGDITETVYYQDINWNGVIEDHIIHAYNDRQLVRVSDYVPDYNSLLVGGWVYANTTSADGSTYGWSFDMANAPVDENGSKSFLCNDSVFGLMVVFATKDNHQMSFQEGSIQITLPKTGIYFALREDGAYVHNINCGAFRIPVTKVREEALPDTPGKELGTDWLAQIAMPGSLKWDGVIGSRAYVPLAEDDGIMLGYVHVYDDSLLEEMFAPESVSSIAFAIAVNQYGTKIAATNDMDTPIPIVSQENGFVDIADGLIFYVPSDNFSLEDGSVFPKRGLYFYTYSLLPEGIDMSFMNACGLLVVGYSFQDQGGSKSWNDLENKPFYDELQQKRIVLYDGNITFQQDGGDASSLFEGAAYIDITDIENPDSVNFILNGATLNLPFVGTGADLGSTEEPMASALVWRDPEGTGVNLIAFLKNSTTGEAGFLLTGVGEEYIDQTFQFRAQEIIQERVLQQIHPKFVPGYDVSYKNTDTIEWDGKDDGRISCSITDGDLKLTLVKVSDVIPDKALFENEYHYTKFSQGAAVDNTATGVLFEFDNGFIPIDDLVYVVQKDNTSYFDITFPEKGLYFGRIESQSGEKIYLMKLSVPGMSAPSEEVESFKLKPEHLPESKIVVVSADFETLKLEKTPAEIAGLMETGKMVLFSATASPFAITNADGVVTATVSTMNPAYNSDGTGLLEIGTLFFDAEGNLINQKISSLNLNV